MAINTVAYPHEWQSPLIILLFLIIVSTTIFWFTDLDIRCAAIFYASPPAINPWPQELMPLWQFFYYKTPLFVALLIIGAITVIIYGFKQPQLLRSAAFIILTIAIGPGLLVNMVFKDYWGRPRPRQLEIFGGTSSYLPPLAIGKTTNGKSFPAGHASVGFSLCGFWLLWRKRRPRLAAGALFASISLGMLMGLGRMAAGAHFLSDVLWAGFICFFTAIVVYYFILRIPYRETAITLNLINSNFKHINIVVYSGIGLTVLIGAMFSFPINERIDYRLPAQFLSSPHNVFLDVRYAQLTLYLNNTEILPMHVNGTVRGFGLTHKIDNYSYVESKPDKTLVYVFKQKGFFTELDTKLHINLNVSNITKLTVYLREGDIRVMAKPGILLPLLNLHTQKGLVLPVVTK